MDIRFDVKDARGETFGWRITTNRMGCTLERFMGISEGGKTKGQERWGKATYPGSIVAACRAIIQEGGRVFPGGLVEVVETMNRLEHEMAEKLRPLISHGEALEAFDLALMKSDASLKLIHGEDAEEEEDSGFSLDED